MVFSLQNRKQIDVMCKGVVGNGDGKFLRWLTSCIAVGFCVELSIFVNGKDALSSAIKAH